MNEVLEVRPRESGRGSSDFSIAGDRPSRSSRLAYLSKLPLIGAGGVFAQSALRRYVREGGSVV